MAETIGALIISAEAAAATAAAVSSATGLTVTAASVTAFVGSTALYTASIGISIGLQYALSNPNVPKPEAGATPIKQAVPPRIRGYWNCRLAGFYMLFAATPSTSYDVIAFHHGKVQSLGQLYFDDDAVSASIANGGISVIGGPGGRYAFSNVEAKLGDASQTASFLLVGEPGINSTWTADFRGDGIAYLAVMCRAPGAIDEFQNMYPRGAPRPSVVAKCSPVWDPRKLDQDRNDPSTWLASPNPVLQLIDYLTRADGGMGLDFDEILPADVLDQWMFEANLCDSRYRSGGWYQFDNAPESVIGKILATCDGWLAEDGEGRLALTVGVYREPSEPAITQGWVLGWSVKHGIADEEAINQLDVTFTNPALNYVSEQIDSVRDDAAIAAAGIIRSKPLDLSWVQDREQAERLGQRAMLRLNPELSGTLTVQLLYGLQYVGKRWIKLDLPQIGLANCVIEVQDRANIDIANRRITFSWTLVDAEALAELDGPVTSLDFSTAWNGQYLALLEDI